MKWFDLLLPFVMAILKRLQEKQEAAEGLKGTKGAKVKKFSRAEVKACLEELDKEEPKV